MKRIARNVAAAGAALLLAAACRSSAPAGTETPLAPGTALTSVHAVRSLMRVRTTSGNQTRSFRAQLLVEPAAGSVEMTAYTPVGTTAMSLFAKGDRVTVVDHINHRAWRGTTADLVGPLGFMERTPPAEWALVALGYVESHGSEMKVTVEPAGTAPAHRVVMVHGADTVDITNLEVVATDASPREPEIPRGYRCCAPEEP